MKEETKALESFYFIDILYIIKNIKSFELKNKVERQKLELNFSKDKIVAEKSQRIK